jgi:hypothetical protein
MLFSFGQLNFQNLGRQPLEARGVPSGDGASLREPSDQREVEEAARPLGWQRAQAVCKVRVQAEQVIAHAAADLEHTWRRDQPAELWRERALEAADRDDDASRDGGELDDADRRRRVRRPRRAHLHVEADARARVSRQTEPPHLHVDIVSAVDEVVDRHPLPPDRQRRHRGPSPVRRTRSMIA